MFGFSSRFLLILVLSGCNFTQSGGNICPNGEICVVEVRIEKDDLLAPVTDVFEAISVIYTDSGEFVVMTNECAYGNLAGSVVRFEYSSKLPDGVESSLNKENVPTSMVAKKVIERRIWIDMTGEEGAVFESDIDCY